MTKIIDGRKAEITDKGRRYSTYREFAEKHGYPEAAAPSDSRDFREKLENGDIVTLLTSGPHLTGYPGATLWVVESANGERHVINEVGLRIMPAEVASITLLPDESLGGVLREYREVKRNAIGGERIKIVNDGAGHCLGIGRVCIAEDADSAEERMLFNASDEPDSPDYVVLEATDILRIDGERLRLVDRKAAVGERVIIVNSAETERVGCNFRHSIGETGVVDERCSYYKDRVHVNGWYIVDGDYRVLEPVITDAAAPLLSEQTPESQAAANIASLALRLTQAEAKIAALESMIGALTERKVASGPVDTTLPSFATPPAKSAQQIRDEIVERAKADVSNPYKFKGTLVPGDPDGIKFWPEGSPFKMHDVTYVVNREKRTVVALIRCTEDGFTVRGIAKCAPGETFNAAIGRGIALHRALGIVVPAEYLNAPWPTEVRVGDVLFCAKDDRSYTVSPRFVGDGKHLSLEHVECYASSFVIADDSREDITSSSALKGAA